MAPASEWSFGLASYLWFSNLTGDIGPFPALPPAEIDADFSDIFENIDWFPPPVMFVGEARRGRFAIITDFIYLGVEGDGSTPLPAITRVEVESKTVVWTFGGSYRAIEDDTFAVDLRAGGRLWHADTEVTLAGPLGSISGDNGETWVDPIIGLAATVNVGDGFALRFAGDVGGFGVASDLTWQALGTVQYRLNDAVALEAGYRHLAVDFEDDGFVFDVSMSGPIIGAGLRF